MAPDTPSIVKAYLAAGMVREFPAKSQLHGREIANRIISEGLWVTDGDVDTYYPPVRLYKVTVAPCPNSSIAQTEIRPSPLPR